MFSFTEAITKAYNFISKFYTIENVSEEFANIYWDRFQIKWRIESDIEIYNRVYTFLLFVLFKKDFPFSLPKILTYKIYIDRLGYIPHLDFKSNVFAGICTFDENSNITNIKAPGELVYECIKSAEKILKDGFESKNQNDFKDEFLAYWDYAYSYNDKVIRNCLSLIPETVKNPGHITYIELSKKIGIYDKMIFLDDKIFQEFESYFFDNKIQYKKFPAFYVGEIDLTIPPFVLTIKKVKEIFDSKNFMIKRTFEEYLKTTNKMVIIFKKVINNRCVFLGWIHKTKLIPVLSIKGLYRQFETLNELYGDQNSSSEKLEREKRLLLNEIDINNIITNPENFETVTRISSKEYTPYRMENRSAINVPRNKKQLKICIIGLGSVGSNLVYFLRSLRIKEFGLIDPDILSVDNLGRHFLGITSTGLNKAVAIGRYLKDLNPHYIINTIEDSSIVEVITDNPQQLNKYDFIFMAIGDANSERLVDEAIKEGIITTPIFILWVEPYLLGGHCVFLNPKDKRRYSELFEDNFYKYTVISQDDHKNRTFTKREFGCQTSFMPYSSSDVVLFLSYIYPYIYKTMISGEKKNKYITWIGDLSLLKKTKLNLSGIVKGKQSFDLLVN